MAMNYLMVALGGAIGSVLRYWVSLMVAAMLGQSFPWGTILINITGSFAIGIAATTLKGQVFRLGMPLDPRVFVMVGLCGGYTTFSSFSLQTLQLLQEGAPARALLNVALSVALCLAAVWLGYLAGAR